MKIRPRGPGDLITCEQMADHVLVTDGYPPRLAPGGLRDFIAAPDSLGAWVAVDADDMVVGQAVLNPNSSREVMALAQRVTGLPPGRFGVVARLVVSPSARRTGVATALLNVVTAAARERGLLPLLDVATHFSGAISLYEACGWRCIGQVSVAIADQDPLPEYVYLAP